jgi:hypothetical protein
MKENIKEKINGKNLHWKIKIFTCAIYKSIYVSKIMFTYIKQHGLFFWNCMTIISIDEQI